MPDDRREPYPGIHNLKYTFDTTHLTMEGLYEYTKNYPANSVDIITFTGKGHEFLVGHRLYKNQLFELIDSKITLFSFPPD